MSEAHSLPHARSLSEMFCTEWVSHFAGSFINHLIAGMARTYKFQLRFLATYQLNPDNPLGRRSGEGRNPAIKNIPRSGQNHDIVPLAWGIFNYLDTGPAPV